MRWKPCLSNLWVIAVTWRIKHVILQKGNYRRKVRNGDCRIMTPQNNLASKVIFASKIGLLTYSPQNDAEKVSRQVIQAWDFCSAISDKPSNRRWVEWIMVCDAEWRCHNFRGKPCTNTRVMCGLRRYWCICQLIICYVHRTKPCRLTIERLNPRTLDFLIHPSPRVLPVCGARLDIFWDKYCHQSSRAF